MSQIYFVKHLIVMVAKIILRRREYNNDSDVNIVSIHSALCGKIIANFKIRFHNFQLLVMLYFELN